MHSYMVTDYLAVVFLPSLGTLLCLNEGKDDFIFYFFLRGGIYMKMYVLLKRKTEEFSNPWSLYLNSLNLNVNSKIGGQNPIDYVMLKYARQGS